MANGSVILLLDGATRELREAKLWDAIEERHLRDLETTWPAALKELLARAPKSHREESSHWDWRDKVDRARGAFGSQGYAVECDQVTQAVMLVDLNRASRIPATKGESIVYVDYLEVAPWNRPPAPVPQFKGVGTFMMQVAIALSREMEFGGRVGLHSLSQPEGFYLHCGMTELWRDPDYYYLKYFEMTASQASNFMSKGGAK